MVWYGMVWYGMNERMNEWMNVCMYVCMYVYVYVCVCVCMCMYVYVCVCMCMYVYVCVCMCMYVYVYVYVDVEPLYGQKRPRTILLCAVHDSCELVRLQEIIHFFHKTACQLLQHFHLQQAVSIGDSTVTKCERADSGRPTCEQRILAQGLREEYFPFRNIVSISSQP